MVDEDVEIDGVGAIVCGSEGSEASGEGGEAVVGEDFDCEGEIRGIGIVGFEGFDVGIGGLGLREEMEGGVGEGVESKGSEGEEEEG